MSREIDAVDHLRCCDLAPNQDVGFWFGNFSVQDQKLGPTDGKSPARLPAGRAVPRRVHSAGWINAGHL